MIDKSSFINDPNAYTLKRIGGKWKPHILWGTSHDIPMRFSKAMHIIPITERVLAQNLRELEADGLIRREVYPEIPPRVEYSLTENGRSAVELLRQIYIWGRERMLEEGIEPDPLGELHHGFLTPEEYNEKRK